MKKIAFPLLILALSANVAHAQWRLGSPLWSAQNQAAKKAEQERQAKKDARHADAGSCYAINDADARTYCLARSHREPATCYAIQQPDLRAACLGEVRK